jgi:hypothetical protein
LAFLALNGLCSARAGGTVLAPTLAPVVDTLTVESASDNVIADAGKVFNSAAADQHHRVLLQIVPFASDISGDFDTIGQPHARNLA